MTEHWNARQLREQAESRGSQTLGREAAEQIARGFVTKDSGARAEYESGMVRDTQDGKARFDLLWPESIPYQAQFITRCADLMARGIAKYGERNWEKANTVEELNRFKTSAQRHLNQWVCGDRVEDHAAAVVFNLMAAETTEYKISQVPKPVESPSRADIKAYILSNPAWFRGWVEREARLTGRRISEL